MSFQSTADSHYQAMLAIIRGARREALSQPRVDMPGAKVIPGACRMLVPPPAPDEALPEDISGLLTRQFARVRHESSDDDIEALSKEVEKKGFERLPYKDKLLSRSVVRVFFILCTFCSEDLKNLLINQSRKQDIFEIGIANSWKYWKGYSNAETSLKSLQTESRLEFCESFQEHMIQFAQEYERASFDGVNIAVTELPLLNGTLSELKFAEYFDHCTNT